MLTPATEQPSGTANRRPWRLLAVAAAPVLLVAVAAWYLNSDSFARYVRSRVIAAIEDSTGGTVELGNLDWSLWHGWARVENLTIHGLEAANEAPYVHVDRISLDFGFLSFAGRKVTLRQLLVERPSVHLMIYPDGSTNCPTPRTHRPSERSPVETLFDLEAGRLELKDGVLLLNERRLPLDLSARDVVAALNYSRPSDLYQGRFEAGKIDSHFGKYRPFSSNVAMNFNLHRNSAEITSLRLASQKSSIQATGRIADLRNPVVDLNYQGTIDLQQTAAILRLVEVRAGTMQLAGAGSYSDTAFSARGKLRIRGAQWRDDLLHLQEVGAAADYALNRDVLEISQLSSTVAGGAASGAITIRNWTSRPRDVPETVASSRKPQDGLSRPAQIGKIQLRLKGLSGARLAEAFSKPTLPFPQLHPRGVVDGSLETNWTGTIANANTHLTADSIAPQVSGDEMPVSGHFEATYAGRTGILTIPALELQTRATRIAASGSLGRGTASMRVTAATSDIGEMRPLVQANVSGDLPIQIAGRASFDGTIHGKLSAPNVAGHVQIADFTSTLNPPSTVAGEEPQIVAALRRGSKPGRSKPAIERVAPGKPLRFHWDSFSGDITYGPQSASVRNGILSHDKAQLRLQGTAALAAGKFLPDSPFEMHAGAQDVAFEEVQPLLGLEYPITGSLRFDLSLAGTRRNPTGSGTLSLKNGTAYGEPVESFTANLRFTGQQAQFDDVRLLSGDAEATGAGAYNVQTREFRFNVNGSGIDLARFPAAHVGRMKVGGRAELRARGSGTPEAPVLSGTLHIPDLSINGERAGDLTADAATTGDTLQITARSKLADAVISLDGKVQLRQDLPGDVTLHFSNLDVQPLLTGFARGHSALDGTLHASGSMKRPKELSGKLEITHYLSVVEGVRLTNSDPIAVTFANGTASLDAFRLLGEDTDLTASGTASFIGSRQLNLRADGKVNLKLWQSFNPDISSYGQASLGVQVHGTMTDPVMRGRITIAHGGVSYIDLPNGLSDINGSMVFNEDRLQVEQLTAHTGGGDLKLGGFIVYSRGLGFNLTAVGNDIRIRYPDGVSSNADATLRLSGTLQNSTLSGDIVVNRFSLNPRFDFASYLQRAKQGAEVQNPNSPLANLHLDVHVTSAPELQLQTALGRITGDVDLRLRGTAYRPGVLGRISIVEGEITFNGTKYRLDRGDVAFTNPTRIEPILDLEASARVSNYDISIGLHGSTDKLNSTYRSDPPLPTADVFALLAFGRTTEENSVASTQTTFTQSASNAVLGSALNAAVSNRVQRLFGVSRIKIDPEVGGPENNPNARITVEQQVSNKITLTYITNLTQSAQQVIQFQYNVNRSVSIVGVRDEYGILGFEVQIRQRRK